MFKTSTAFILGAGASVHYGYPTGEGLVGDIVRKGHAFHQILTRFKSALNERYPVYVRDVVHQTPAYILNKAGVDFNQDKKEIEYQKQNLDHKVYDAAIDDFEFLD